jgi:hypothetical protein
VAGEGFVSDANGATAVRAADMVWTPAGVQHWHGGSLDRFMLHTAVTLGGTV